MQKAKAKSRRGRAKVRRSPSTQVDAGGEAGGGELVVGEGEEGWAEIDAGDRVAGGGQGGEDAGGAAAELEEGVAGFFGKEADELDVVGIVAVVGIVEGAKRSKVAGEMVACVPARRAWSGSCVRMGWCGDHLSAVLRAMDAWPVKQFYTVDRLRYNMNCHLADLCGSALALADRA